MFELPEINRRSLVIVGGSTIILALVASVLTIVIVQTSSSAPGTRVATAGQPTTQDSGAEERAGNGVNGYSPPAAGREPTRSTSESTTPSSISGFPSPSVQELMLPPADKLVEDWSWRSHVPIGRPWPEDRIKAYWTDPKKRAEDAIREMNDSLIRRILGLSQ